MRMQIVCFEVSGAIGLFDPETHMPAGSQGLLLARDCMVIGHDCERVLCCK